MFSRVLCRFDLQYMFVEFEFLMFNLNFPFALFNSLLNLNFGLLYLNFYLSYLNYKSGGVVVRAFSLYWSGIKFESLSTHHRWILSKSFISSLVVIVVSIKKIAFGGKITNKKSNGGDWLLWPWASYFEYHSFESTITRPFGCKHGTIACYGELVRKGTGFEKHICLFGVHPAVSGNSV